MKARGASRRLAAAWLLAECVAAGAACPPAGWDIDALERLRAADFRLPDAARRAALAEGLIGCLSDRRPALRDAVAYQALSTWMRDGQLTADQLRSLRERLLEQLEADDPDGFGRPFAALALAEVARVDRLTPYLGVEERADLLVAASAYLRSVRDYRGFDAQQGWRDGVAHGAELLQQLALNPALTREQLDVIVHAVGSQVAPAGEHFFIYGEPDRLARPIHSVAERGLHDRDYWSRWLTELAAPTQRAGAHAPETQAHLARRHNTAAFVQSLYVGVQENGTLTARERLLPALSVALRALP
ncbi:MAG: DUF2785 domain-containing protein [Proteobacteria bacterium]|nr:DUF2785 domain-containing protein [Pseudomonadota bacterium]